MQAWDERKGMHEGRGSGVVLQARRPGHLVPLAMHSGEMMPPPREVAREMGERRLTFHVGVGARFASSLMHNTSASQRAPAPGQSCCR